jgi:predicted NUDIX family phosphoesterase
MVERVLVLPRERVPGGCNFTGIRPAGDAALSELRAALALDGTYLERPIAEADPAFKQVIPYVVLRDGARIFLMERSDAGADARLHRKASIGVGGHLNPIDGAADPLSGGLRREWREELAVGWEPEFRPMGMLNDDSNPVGSVHLGIVFEVDAAGRAVDVRERAKLSGGWADRDALQAAWDRLETWSRLVAEHLGLAHAPVAPLPD